MTTESNGIGVDGMSDKMGIWECGVCGDEKVLPETTVVARCTGVWEITYMGNERATTHWPSVMSCIGITEAAELAQDGLSGVGGGADLSPGLTECSSGSTEVGEALGSPTDGVDDLSVATARARDRWQEAIDRAGQTFSQPQIVERLMTEEDRQRFGVPAGRGIDYVTTTGRQTTRREGPA